jgi:hypothetical protein
MNSRQLERFAFLVLVALVFVWAGWEATSFPSRARIFPQTVAFAALILTGVEVLKALISLSRHRAARRLSQGEAAEEGGATLREQVVKGAPYLLWIIGYYVGIYLVGFVVASGAFVLLFLWRAGRVRWPAATLATAPLLAVLLLLGAAMNLSWPGGLLSGWLSFLAR